MVSRELFYYYKETRVSLDPASPATVVNATVPGANGGRRISGRTGHGAGGRSSGGSLLGGGSSNGGSGGGGDNYTEEERAYRFKSLATEAGIFQRRHHDAPRSFLWRVLENGHVLSVRAMDIGKAPDAGALDAPLTLYLHFPRAIRTGCVALADAAQHDALTVLVLDESCHLHQLQLRPDVFRKRALGEADLGEAWRPYLSATFKLKQPRRLVAVSASEFVVALHDGGVLHFRRAHDGPWKESFHSPVGLMQGLRSILPFQGGPTIKYEGANLERAAAASAVVTSMGLDDVTYLFSVCLDHRLRVWNVERGDVCYTGDVLGVARDAHETGRWTIDPGQDKLVRILELGEGFCVCATYSPVGAGAFKFWKVAATEEGGVELSDFEAAEQPLVPPTPTASDVWTLADFAVARPEALKMSVWVLWKNNLVYRVMKLECAPDELEAAWTTSWVGVHADSSLPTAPTSGPSEAADAAEKWLELVFYPGRFSRATLETALAMYERGLGVSGSSANGATAGGSGGRSLMEAICTTLGAAATLERTGTGAMDYELFRSAGEMQWRRFYRLLVELDKQRGEALSLAIDPELGLGWVVCADWAAAMRECSAVERVYHNAPSRLGLGPDGAGASMRAVSRLLTAGFTLVDSFSDGMRQQSEAALGAALLDDSSRTDEERLQWLADKAGFWRHLTEDDCAQVVDVLGEGFAAADGAAYEALFALLEDAVPTGADAERVPHFPLSQFGQALAVRGVQDAAELQWQVLVAQVLLLVHMETEAEDDARAPRGRLDAGHVYQRLVAALRRLALVRWLGRTEFAVALTGAQAASFSGSVSGSFGSVSGSFGSAAGSLGSLGSPGRRADETTQIVTVLEASVGHLLGLGALSDVPLASLLTDMVGDVCAARSTIELDAAMIQCMLLKRERPDLALALGAFADDDAFSTYVQGRTYLALRDWDTAAALFDKAAVGLATKLRVAPRHSAGLIDDAEWNLLYSGLPNYYAHIVSLYDRHKAYSFVVDFARRSLQFTPPSAAAASTLSTTALDMQSRLFAAAAALSRFDVAHTALVALRAAPDAGLQRSCLRFLVEKMAEGGQVAALLALPFPGLRDAVDDVLAHRCRAATEVLRGTPWHRILYAWRVAHNDYRGAAAVLLDRLQKLQQAGAGDTFGGSGSPTGNNDDDDNAADVLDTPVTRQYLQLINTLSCVAPKQAWIYTEDASLRAADGDSIRPSVESDAGEAKPAAAHSGGDALRALLQQAAAATRPPWRRVVTLADIRKQYQDELDRIAAIQNNQFAFADDVSMEEF